MTESRRCKTCANFPDHGSHPRLRLCCAHAAICIVAAESRACEWYRVRPKKLRVVR